LLYRSWCWSSIVGSLHQTRKIHWWSGIVDSMLASINIVNQCWARLVLRWVTISGFNSLGGILVLVCDQLPRGGDALRLCDPLVTHVPYLSALDIRSLYIERYKIQLFFTSIRDDVA